MARQERRRARKTAEIVNRRLSAKKAASLGRGRRSDGGDLHLVVSPSGARRWSFVDRAPTENHGKWDQARPVITKFLSPRPGSVRRGENPATRRDRLEHLPPNDKPTEEQRHAALPCRRAPASIAQLISSETIAARALKFLISTAARTSEAIRAVPEGFDLDEAIWTVRAERLKGKKAHPAPLPNRA